MSRRPRIVFMGTPRFAVSALTACADVGELVAVVTQPDRPRGRGQDVSFSPVKEEALARGLRVLQPPKLKDTSFADELLALAPDVCVVAAYGKLLPKHVLELPPRGCVNLHASLLPRFRGAAPIQWAIASGDRETGVCLMRMDEGLDTGPVIACARTAIEPCDTYQSLHDKLAELGRALLVTDLPRYLAGELVPAPQPTEGIVLAPLLGREDGRLDFSRPAIELVRRVRGFNPWPGAFTYRGQERVKLLEASERSGRGEPGRLLSVSPEGLEVACGHGSLLMRVLQPEGARAMSALEFVSGRDIGVGQLLFGGKTQ